MRVAEPEGYRRVSPGWRPVFAAFLLLTLAASVLLYGFPGATATWFAWTVAPEVSAAFLGGGYAAGFVLVAGTARQRLWAAARVGVITIFVFVVATLAATLLHLDRFHFGNGGSAAAAAWIWMAVYVGVPVAMAGMFAVQSRVTGEDPPVREPLPPPLRWLLAGQAVVLTGTGAALLLAPGWVAAGWPWELTPLTGRAVGAWCLPLGLAAALVLAERDLDRLRVPALAYLVLAVLHTVALGRFAADIRWQLPATWIYVAVLLSMAGAALWGLLRQHPASRGRHGDELRLGG